MGARGNNNLRGRPPERTTGKFAQHAAHVRRHRASREAVLHQILALDTVNISILKEMRGFPGHRRHRRLRLPAFALRHTRVCYATPRLLYFCAGACNAQYGPQASHVQHERTAKQCPGPPIKAHTTATGSTAAPGCACMPPPWPLEQTRVSRNRSAYERLFANRLLVYAGHVPGLAQCITSGTGYLVKQPWQYGYPCSWQGYHPPASPCLPAVHLKFSVQGYNGPTLVVPPTPASLLPPRMGAMGTLCTGSAVDDWLLMLPLWPPYVTS